MSSIRKTAWTGYATWESLVDGSPRLPGILIPAHAEQVVDASGLYVTPGLIDMHAHVFHGAVADNYLANSYGSLPPAAFTFRSGVTTIVDTGGAGWRTIRTFIEQTVGHAETRVLAFLNIVGQGMKGEPIEQDLSDMDSKLTAMAAGLYADVVVGVKLAHYLGRDWTPVERAVEAGRQAGVPVMIDFGRADPPLPLRELFLDHLRPGDIFTHAYAAVSRREAIVEDGVLRPFVLEAAERGIVFDVGHGGGSFFYSVAVPATEAGLWPHTISTDLHTGSMNHGMKDMANVMSKISQSRHAARRGDSRLNLVPGARDTAGRTGASGCGGRGGCGGVSGPRGRFRILGCGWVPDGPAPIKSRPNSQCGRAASCGI